VHDAPFDRANAAWQSYAANLEGRCIEFERSVRQAHRQRKTNFFRWLVTDRPQGLITGPLIYVIAKIRCGDEFVFGRSPGAPPTSSRSSTAHPA